MSKDYNHSHYQSSQNYSAQTNNTNQEYSNLNQCNNSKRNTYQQGYSSNNLNNNNSLNSNRASNKRSFNEYIKGQEEEENQSRGDSDNHQLPAQRIKSNYLENHNHNNQVVNDQSLEFVIQNPQLALEIIQTLTIRNSSLSQLLLTTTQQSLVKDVNTALLVTQFIDQHNHDDEEKENLRTELVEKQTVIDRQSNLIKEYIIIKGDLTEKLFLYEQKKPPPDKLAVLKELEKILLTETSRSLLVDFVTDEINKKNTLNQVGRVEVDGRKQHRHIIPHAMLTKTIETAVISETKANLLIANLSEIITAIYNFKKNVCLTKKQYFELKTNKDIYFDKITTTSNTYYFIDAEQHAISYDDLDTTMEAAENLFKQKYKKHIIHDLENLAKAAGDDVNTKTMISELLIKFVYTIFNQNSVVSYPDAGNSRNYEIRLYKNDSDAKNHKDKKYEVLTHSEVAKYFKEDRQAELSGKIRIVNNEGDIVKKSIAVFDLLNNIINCGINFKDSTDLINKYNKTHNKTLKLENLNINLELYNKPLTQDSLESQIIFHIVKYLYFSLDFKPLEKDVFVHSKKGIKIYNNATTKVTSYFNIADGYTFRNKERKDNQDKIPYRTEELDKTALGEKLFKQVGLLSMSYPSFRNAFEIDKYDNKILQEYFKLCSSAHNIDIKKEDYSYNLYNDSFNENSVIVDITGETQWI